MRLSTIDFKNLSKVAREIEQALPTKSSVNFADVKPTLDLSEKIDNLNKSMEKMVLQINRRFSRSKTPNRQYRLNRSNSRGRSNYQGAGRSSPYKRGRSNSNNRMRSNSRGRPFGAKKSWRDIPQANFRCFNCGKYGHLQKWCRLPKKPTAK